MFATGPVPNFLNHEYTTFIETLYSMLMLLSYHLDFRVFRMHSHNVTYSFAHANVVHQYFATTTKMY